MRPELLAPAGSYEALQAALTAGADAVYIGGSKFGARAFAENLDEKSLCRAIDEVHLKGKKLYLTVNTLLKQQELDWELYDYLKPYYEQGLDAVIVQDYGVLRSIRRWFPDLPVHCSTQMTITGPMGAKLLEEQGVTRIVTARELSLQEINSIHQTTDLEIESFVHGALCYCYSGQCLFSSIIGGRSGNRGRCAQPCRLPYQVRGGERTLNGVQDAYALSPKDMCTLDILPDILKAGVTSLKIEGRMKKPAYTAGVVGIYRKYLDLCLADPHNYHVDEKDMKELAAIYNRDGFNRGYYQVRNGKNMMALRNKKNEGLKQAARESQIREQVYEQIKNRYMDRKSQEKIKGSFTIYSDTPAILTLYAGDHVVTVEREGVQIAKNQPLTTERIEKQLRKTGDSPFVFESLDIFAGDDVFVPMQFLNEIRRDGLALLEDEILRQYHRECQAWKDTAEQKKSKKQKVKLTASVETREQLTALLKVDEIESLYLGYEIFEPKLLGRQVPELIQQLSSMGKQIYLALPHVVREGELDKLEPYLKQFVSDGISGYLVRNLESFGILKKHNLESYAVLDHSIYTMNDQAQLFWKEQGACKDTASLEQNDRELMRRCNESSEMIAYGYLPMMVSAQCIKKNLSSCTKANERLTLKDRYGKDFIVQCCCNTCYNVIYNSVPLVLLKEEEQVKSLSMQSLRLSFTTEDYETTQKVAQLYVDRYLHERSVEYKGEYTKGHFKRGIE